MRFRIEQAFEGALEAVQEAFVDPAFLAKLSELPKLGRPELIHRVETDEGLVHQWVQFRFTGEVNSAVRRVVDPNKLTWVEESTLNRETHRTTWRIVPDHYRNLLRSSGTFQLEAGGPRRTRRITEGDMKVSFPLVGGKVEAAIVSGLREHATGEEQVMAGYLAGR